MENIVWKIRTWIYLVGIAVFIFKTATCSGFWAPDMVPHPDIPGIGPSGSDNIEHCEKDAYGGKTYDDARAA